MQNVDVQNPDVSGLEDKHTPSPTSDSISGPLCLCFVFPVPQIGCVSPHRAGSGLPAILEQLAASALHVLSWCTLEQSSGSLLQLGCSHNPESL